MNKWKKAISVGMSATLLASLFTVIAASSALASSSVTGVGTVPRGGESTTTATFLFTESAIDAINNTTPGSFTVSIFDSSADCNNAGTFAAASTVHFGGTGAISAPGSLDASLAVGDNSFTVTLGDDDEFNVETVSVTGLTISADTDAATGAMKACVTADADGIFAAAFATGTTTATGKLSSAIGIGTTDFVVALDAGSCAFSGTNDVTIGTETVSGVTVVADAIPGLYDFSTDATTTNHLANEVVKQTVPNCNVTTLGSPGSVADSLVYEDPGTPARLNPGETNQLANELNAHERTAGFLAAGATISLTITTPGVTFSMAPRADVDNGLVLTGSSTGTSNIYGILSAGNTVVTWTVDTASSSAADLNFEQIFYDVAGSVTSGTFVNVTLATSAGTVVPTSRSNAVIGRVLNVTATSPVVYIGENNQTAGQITITETGPGFFQAGTGANNTLAVCIIFNGTTNEQFASAPWAKVTAGDLKLREGAVASADNVVQGTPIFVAGFPFACYYWTVWSASTTASTVVLSGDEAGTTGVKINVPAGSSVGPVTASIRTGNVNAGVFTTVLEARATIALRQFRNQVVVTALSQPVIPRAANGAPAGNIQIQETANGQLKFGERICVEVLPNAQANNLQDAFLKSINTADVPIVTASNGILVSGVTFSTQFCNGELQIGASNLAVSFSFFIEQQSTTGNGTLVISNIKYGSVNDAAFGPVQVNVFGFGNSNTNIDFQSLISNAKVGTTTAGTAATRLGVTQVGAFTTSTKVQKVGKYVTYRFDFGIGAAGAHVDIWGATKTGNDWSAFSKITTRVANASGVVYYYIRQSSATWKSYRAMWAGGGVWSPARQARWIP